MSGTIRRQQWPDATFDARAVATTPSPAHVTAGVGLKALITHGSATNWNADGIDKFYGLDWNAKYGPTTVSQFSLFPHNVNPDNLKAALRGNVGDGDPDLVLTSGRGLGAATVTMLNSGKPEDRRLVLDTRWILDNNVNRPNGGYGSRYIPFTILGVYPWPTPTEEGVDIVDVGYEYAWNSSAPAYVTNVLALLNSIIAYAYRYKSQAFTGLPEDPNNPGAKDPITGEPVLEKGYHYIVEVDGTVTKVPLKSLGSTNTAYVTYRADGLPMLQPLRDVGGQFGNAVADLLQPALKALNKLPAAIKEGVDNFKQDVGLTKKPAPTTPAPKTAEEEEGPQTTAPSDAADAAVATLASTQPEEQSTAPKEGTATPVKRHRLTDADESAHTKDTKDTTDTKATRIRPRPLRQLADRVTKALTPKVTRPAKPSPAGTASTESTGHSEAGDSKSGDADS